MAKEGAGEVDSSYVFTAIGRPRDYSAPCGGEMARHNSEVTQSIEYIGIEEDQRGE